MDAGLLRQAMVQKNDPNWAIVSPDVAGYVDSLANRGDETLKAVEGQGDREGWPIVGAAEGSFLHVLARAIGAKRVLELGTAIGYSGTWFARALPDGGQLITVEGNPATAKTAQANLEKTGVASKATILVGSAQEILEDLEGPFDLIFVDINKGAYPDVLEPCIRRLRVGGLLVTDNVLWGGDVARKSRSKETQAIRSYNKSLAKDPRMIASILPLRDGVSVALKVRE
jgi:predicted O-methyltransferase YrrM